MAANASRLSTGVDALDEHLGGGLLPGSLTVVLGATGIGKTQLGIQFAQAGLAQQQRRGVILDLSARGDSQSHAAYARRLYDWPLRDATGQPVEIEHFYEQEHTADYLHAFEYRGRRVTREDLDWEAWRAWQAEINQRLAATIAFLYGNFLAGCRRVVIDGLEPTDKPRDSIQQHLFEYVYHQIVRKDPQWVARDLLRQHYRANAAHAAARTYDPAEIGCLLLLTSHESMLDDLIARPLDEGDVLSNANTLIYMGKIRDGYRIGRALYLAKHRGSMCSDELLPYHITERGLQLD